MVLFRRGGLPKTVFASLDATAGGAKVLAWSRLATGHLVGLPDRLAVGIDDEWRFVGWHEIETGGWDRESSELRWTRVDGTSEKWRLTEPGGLPGLFRERVDATILVRLPYQPLGSAGRVIITARRGLGADQTIVWGWSHGDSAHLSSAAVADIEAEIARVRAEYEAA